MMEDQHEKTAEKNVAFRTRVATASNTTVVFLNIIHRPAFYLKHNVPETE
jgi:hypothetical protein